MSLPIFSCKEHQIITLQRYKKVLMLTKFFGKLKKVDEVNVVLPPNFKTPLTSSTPKLSLIFSTKSHEKEWGGND